MERHGSVKKRKQTKEQNREGNLKKRYGITASGYATMLAEQNGVCAICSYAPSDTSKSKILVVDHCHATGEIRGLICHWCNSGLGYFKDSSEVLSSAIRYLTIWKNLRIMKSLTKGINEHETKKVPSHRKAIHTR